MPEETKTQDENNVPFYPDHVALEAKVALGFGIAIMIIGVIGLFNPVGLGPPADPMDTPADTKPEWYFLFLYQLLKFIPKGIGASAPVVALLLLAVWPFIDSKPDKTLRARRIRWIVSAVVLLAIIALTIWGEVS
jgi:quinol-cytochrome oxidoreductase complex cytochrome b subunit